MAGAMLFCSVMLSQVAMLPSIAVVPAPVLPPCTAALHPFRFGGSKADYYMDMFASRSAEAGQDDLQEEIEDKEYDRFGHGGAEKSSDSNEASKDRSKRLPSDLQLRGSDLVSDDQSVVAHSSEFRFMMSRPGYVHQAPLKVTRSASDPRNSITWPSVGNGLNVGGSLLLSHMLVREGRGGASARQLKAPDAATNTSVPVCSADGAQTGGKKAVRDSSRGKRLQNSPELRLSVSEGAARLKELSALMRSLRTFQATTGAPSAGIKPKDALPELQGLLQGFAKLKLPPPASLVSSIPATAELKGELVARLGGLSGRFEVANMSSGISIKLKPCPILIPKEALISSLAKGRRAQSGGIHMGDSARFLAHVAAVGDSDLSNVEWLRTSPFWAHKKPKVSLEEYCARIAKYSACSSGNFLLAIIYLDRFLASTPGYKLTSRNVHRLLLACVLVATKQWDDQHYNNAFWAKAGGISNAELNSLESALLAAIGWRLHVDKPEFDLFQDLAARLGCALGCSHAAQSSPSADELVHAPCSGADVPALSVSPVALAGREPLPPPAPSEGMPGGMSGMALPRRGADDADSCVSTPWSGPESPAARRPCASAPSTRRHARKLRNGASGSGGAGGGGGGGGCSAGRVADDKQEYDIEVLKEKLLRMKEARLFRSGPPPAAVGVAAGEQASERGAAAAPAPAGGRWGPSWDRRSPRPCGPLYDAMAKMLADSIGANGPAARPQDTQAGRRAGDEMPSASAAAASKLPAPSASAGGWAVGGGRAWGGAISVEVVEGLEPVPAA